MPTFCLSFHAGYRCRHSGACCTSGWSIPVEPALRHRLEAALQNDRLSLSNGSGGAPEGQPRDFPFVEGERLNDGSSILALGHDGACACYDRRARRCHLHAQLGHEALPVACQHFPRVCLVDRDGVFVTLSHYCPTAARLLISAGDDQLQSASLTHPIAIVEAPTTFAPMALEGLDAREALPPLLRPRMLADRESYRLWERLAVRALSDATTAEGGLSFLIEATEGLRDWEPRVGPLEAAVAEAFARRPGDVKSGTALSAAALSLNALARQCVPPGLSAPGTVEDAPSVYASLVAPRWAAFAGVVRRYLAAKVLGNWCAYQGRGLRSVVCSLVAAFAVLRVEAARHCGMAGRVLDDALVIEALRSADLLLVHLASQEELARRLSDIEEAGAGELRSAVGTV